jgi:2-oxoglutarate ferredoxin oxidoreductase subunit gamma
VRIRFAGFGGQGIVLCGFVVGKAAMLDGRNSFHTQSYGSASRGGLTTSDVGIEDGEIYDLVHDRLDLLVTMSQQSYDANRGALIEGGLLFFESDLVRPSMDDTGALGLAATDIAYKTFGRKVFSNILMIGFVNQIAGLVSLESLIRTVTEVVPPGTEETNIAALEEGMRRGEELSATRRQPVAVSLSPPSERGGTGD